MDLVMGKYEVKILSTQVMTTLPLRGDTEGRMQALLMP